MDQQQRPLLDRIRPFAVIDRRRRSLAEALQVRAGVAVERVVVVVGVKVMVKVVIFPPL